MRDERVGDEVRLNVQQTEKEHLGESGMQLVMWWGTHVSHHPPGAAASVMRNAWGAAAAAALSPHSVYACSLQPPCCYQHAIVILPQGLCTHC